MKRSSVRSKMLIGVTVPVILVMVCAGTLISANVKKTVKKQAVENLEAEAAAASFQVSEFFTGYLSGVEQAASSYQIETFNEAVANTVRINEAAGNLGVMNTLKKMALMDSENIVSAWVSDLDTSQIMQSDDFVSEPGWDVTKRPWYQACETRKAVLTEPYENVSTGSLIVTAAAPVIASEGGAVTGAVGFDISLDSLYTAMSKYKVGRDGFIILCTANGQVIYHPDSSYIRKNVSDTDWPSEVKDAFSSAFTGSLNYSAQGNDYTACMNEVGSAGWYVLSALPDTEIMEAYYATIRTIILIFAVGVVVLTAIIIIISGGVSRPLKNLAGVAEEIAAGNLDVAITTKSSDETGLVADAMGKTVLRLKDYINYINEISAVLNRIAAKELVFDLKYDYAGEFSKIKEALLNIRETLSETLEQIHHTAKEVEAGSSHVSASAQNLAQGATQQASSVEELAATIEDISEQVKQNAKDSKEADRLVSEVTLRLNEGNGQMRQLRAAMEEISASSSQIEQIIKTIEDISFQTNILALNAAVEAARAGAAGKGFAVVADEVRNLASKSSEAAKGTTQLINNSLESVKIGARLAQESTSTMNDIVERADRTKDAIDRIAGASTRQADAVSQVSLGVEQISGVVQNNSATAEESAAASEQLLAQSKLLEEMVGKFKLQ